MSRHRLLDLVLFSVLLGCISDGRSSCSGRGGLERVDTAGVPAAPMVPRLENHVVAYYGLPCAPGACDLVAQLQHLQALAEEQHVPSGLLYEVLELGRPHAQPPTLRTTAFGFRIEHEVLVHPPLEFHFLKERPMVVIQLGLGDDQTEAVNRLFAFLEREELAIDGPLFLRFQDLPLTGVRSDYPRKLFLPVRRIGGA
ncbi:MAG: hypothetical protein A2284_09710 [Deltaproteobacteria bacterium RIFOXYA12_FULL_61_11]|nr:MAG: hypothetical protein A2284_09710 [Deltaproteobacteria bacterium RIFOXYA12_FULL_61_11]